jgi:short-subunit dehydrogenase
MFDFQGKVIVITGAASGIGAALAMNLAQRSARLMLADIDAMGLETLAKTLQAQGCDCHWAVTDTGSEAAIYALAELTQAKLGEADVVINNAGVSLISPVEKLKTSDAQWLMAINFWGVVHGCQAFLPQLRTRPAAVLVNVSSIFAMVSMPTQSIYNASKAAVRGFSDALREELRGTAVTVLCVHPGGIRTNIANKARITDSSMVADSDQMLREGFAKLARTSPEQAAAVIVSAIASGKTRVLIGGDAKFMDFLFRLAPSRASAWLTRIGKRLREKARADAA